MTKTKSKATVRDEGGTWQFVNLCVPQHAKDPVIRKIIRVNAASRPNSKSGSQKPNRPANESRQETAIACRPGVSEPLSNATLAPHESHTGAWSQKEASTWPNQWEQLVIEVQELCSSLSSSAEADTLDEDMPYLKSSSLSRLAPDTSPDCFLGSGNLDPFDAFPAKDSPQNSKSIHHSRYCLPIDRGTDNNPIRTHWLPLIMDDPVLFQATITYVAVHLDLLHGRQGQAKTLIQKAETMKMINEQLRCGEKASSDSTIGAITMLANAERTDGNLEEVLVHESAIGKMVSLRGGLTHLGNEVLRMWLSWGDLATSTMLGVPSRFVFHPCSAFQNTPFSANISSPDPTSRNSSHTRLSIIFEQLRYLTDQVTLASTAGNCISDFDMVAYSEARSYIEHSLLSLSPTPNTTTAATTHSGKQISGMSPSYEAHRLAALIYVNVVFRRCSPPGGLLQCLKSQLINTIRTAEKTMSWLSRRRTGIWVYFMGGLISLNSTEELWFTERIRATMERLQIESWEEVEEALEEVLWTDMLKTKAWRSLWQRVQDTQ